MAADLFEKKDEIYLFEHTEVIGDHFLSKHTSHTTQKQTGKTQTFPTLIIFGTHPLKDNSWDSVEIL